MKFTAEKEDLLAALSRCVGVAEQKSTNPILGTVRIAAGPDLSMRATDLMRGIACRVDGATQKEGSICLGAHDLLERVKLMPDGAIVVDVDGSKATIKAKSASRRFTMHGIPGDEFPVALPKHERLNPLDTSTHKLAQVLSAVHHAVSTDPTRLQLNAVNLEHWDGHLRAVATDGHRVAAVSTGELDPTSKPAAWLIPASGIAHLRKLCDTKADESVTLFESREALFAEFDAFDFSCKLTAGSFVPWQQVVPEHSERSVTVDRKALIEALRAVGTATGLSGAVRFVFGETLRLESESPSGGDAFDEVACESVSGNGQSATIGLSHHYMLNALSVLGVDKVSIGSSGELDPVLIKVPGRSEFLACVMPIRI